MLIMGRAPRVGERLSPGLGRDVVDGDVVEGEVEVVDGARDAVLPSPGSAEI